MNLTKEKIIELGQTARKMEGYTDEELKGNVELLDLLISYFIARGDSGIIIQRLSMDRDGYSNILWARNRFDKE